MVSASVLIVLCSLLLIGLSTARARAKKIQCMSNLHQIGMAVLVYGGDHGVFVPCLTATGDWTDLLKPYLDEAGSTYSSPIDRSPVIVCPSRAIKLPDFETTYAAHRKVLVNMMGPDFDAPRRVANLTRPAEIVMLGDAMQLPSYDGGRCVAAYDFQHDPEWTLQGVAATRDDPVSSVDMDADGVGENVRFRHDGTANLLFADGHISSMRPAEFKERHVMLGY